MSKNFINQQIDNESDKQANESLKKELEDLVLAIEDLQESQFKIVRQARRMLNKCKARST